MNSNTLNQFRSEKLRTFLRLQLVVLLSFGTFFSTGHAQGLGDQQISYSCQAMGVLRPRQLVHEIIMREKIFSHTVIYRSLQFIDKSGNSLFEGPAKYSHVGNYHGNNTFGVKVDLWMKLSPSAGKGPQVYHAHSLQYPGEEYLVIPNSKSATFLCKRIIE